MPFGLPTFMWIQHATRALLDPHLETHVGIGLGRWVQGAAWQIGRVDDDLGRSLPGPRPDLARGPGLPAEAEQRNASQGGARP